MMDGIDFENVTIGKWQSSIPSEICINKEIFDEIFSKETWCKVLMPDQRERIQAFLPRDVLDTPGAAQQTMEDLLARTLNRFDANPLDTFYTQLEQGRYDPNVVQTKKALSNAWRKEAVRKRKKYHAKLLQDVVVSRERHLQEDFVKRNAASSSSTPALSSTNSTELNQTGSQSTRVKSESKDLSSFQSLVEKSYREEIAAINREVGCISSSDDESPPKKSAKLAKKTLTKTKPKPKATKASASVKANSSTEIIKSVEAPSIPLAPPVPTTSAPVRAATQIKIPPPAPVVVPTTPTAVLPRVNRDEQTAVQMAKFPKILPAPAAATVVNVSAPTVTTAVPASPILASLTSPVATLPSHQILTAALKTQPLASTNMTPSTPVMPFQTNPVRSSPILASQLQSTTPIPNSSKHTPGIPNLTSTPNQKVTVKPPARENLVANVKIRNSSEDDDLESSSDDEFEAIEPTIGFTTKPTLPVTKATNQKFSNPKSTVSTYSSVRNLPVTGGLKVEPVKTKVNITAAPKTIIAVNSTAPTPGTASTVNCSNMQLNKILSQPPQSVVVSQATAAMPRQNLQPPLVQQKINVVRLVTQPSGAVKNYPAKAVIPASILSGSVASPSSNLVAVHSSSVPTVVQATSTMTTAKTSVAPSPVTKMLPITVNIQQPSKAPVVRPVTSMGTHAAIVSLPTRQVTLNGPVNSIINISGNSATTVSGASAMPNAAVTSSSAGLQMFNLFSPPNVIDAMGNDLNLNLGLAMNNLNDGGAVAGEDDVVDLGDPKFTKLPDMEKIDELSVLDGNPFDSIPNLSDELDGLDLDLVDGLCDFEVLLSEEKQYASFFSLIRDVLCSTRDHRMTLVCLEKTIQKWSVSPTAALNSWFHKVHNWNEALITALNFLAGNYQDVHPEDFVPYIEYKYKTKYYQWIGAGRDSDNNLSPLCNMWLENLDRLQPLKKMETENDDQEEEDDENEDSDGGGEEAKKKCKRPQTPPPPRCVTDWTVRPSTQAEKEAFQAQERQRFENPHKAFTYQMHGYESVVGPVKGVYSSQSGMTNKARGHSLLVDDRPPYVTILALVRDAVARLPNGEGTRSEICEMLRDSQFLAPEASNVTLNSVVSGALDRLHYERDPCVRYDSHKKSWVYLHRDRTQEQFERLHHNRSYTKSTKSRSNTSRKSRKSGKTQPQPSSPPATPSTTVKEPTAITSTPAAVTVTSTATVASAPSATPTTVALTAAKLPPVGTLITKTTLSANTPQLVQFTPSNVRQVSTPMSAENTTVKTSIATPKPTVMATGGGVSSSSTVRQILTVDGNSQIVSAAGQTGSVRKLPLNEVLAAASSLGSAIRFATVPGSNTIVAVSGSSGTMSVNSGSEQASSGIVFRTTGVSSLGSSITTPTLTASGSNLVTPQTVQFQVQNVSSGMKTVPVSMATMTPGPSVSVAQANAVNNSSINSGQLLLNPSTVIRLANSIRLPEGVRFAQVRLPVQQTANQPMSSNPVRLPQQRIILTRAALSGQNQAQGVLLTQTPSGQTVILSTTPGALGHLQGASTHHIPITITSQASAAPSESSGHLSNTSTSIASQQMNQSLAVSVGSGLHRPQTISVMTSSPVGTTSGVGHSTEISGSQVVLNSPAVMSAASAGMVPASQASTILQQMQQVTGAQHIVAQVGGQILQQNASGTASSSPQLASPIIIRSQQGDFVIPGHISLGRGVQGIKVIPVSTGKQTVLARIVAPSQQQPQQATSASSANTHPQQ